MSCRISSESLSQLLTWCSHYDLIEIPTDRMDWYNEVPNLRKWIQLGRELRGSQDRRTLPFWVRTACYALLCACEDLGIDNDYVETRIVRLASPRRMGMSGIMDALTTQEWRGNVEDFLKIYFEKERDTLRQLRLEPGSLWHNRKARVELRVHEILILLIYPLLVVMNSDKRALRRRDDLRLTSISGDACRRRHTILQDLMNIQLRRLIPLCYYDSFGQCKLRTYVQEKCCNSNHSLILRKLSVRRSNKGKVEKTCLKADEIDDNYRKHEFYVLRRKINQLQTHCTNPWDDGPDDTSVISDTWELCEADSEHSTISPTDTTSLDSWLLPSPTTATPLETGFSKIGRIVNHNQCANADTKEDWPLRNRVIDYDAGTGTFISRDPLIYSPTSKSASASAATATATATAIKHSRIDSAQTDGIAGDVHKDKTSLRKHRKRSSIGDCAKEMEVSQDGTVTRLDMGRDTAKWIWNTDIWSKRPSLRRKSLF